MIRFLFISLLLGAQLFVPLLANSLDCSSVTTQQERDKCVEQALPINNMDTSIQPGLDATTSQTVGSAPKHENFNLALKIAAVVSLLICLTSIYLHHQGALTIYSNYTDAAFTSLVLPIALVTYLVLHWLEVPVPYPTYCAAGLGGGMLLQIIRSTIAANGIGIRALMALITKICMIVAFYLILALILGRSTSRRQGESQSAYDRRSRREQREAQASAAAATAAYTGLTAWLCRNSGFSSLGDYLSGSTH